MTVMVIALVTSWYNSYRSVTEDVSPEKVVV